VDFRGIKKIHNYGFLLEFRFDWRQQCVDMLQVVIVDFEPDLVVLQHQDFARLVFLNFFNQGGMKCRVLGLGLVVAFRLPRVRLLEYVLL
jgi:hypothetical protein